MERCELLQVKYISARKLKIGTTKNWLVFDLLIILISNSHFLRIVETTFFVEFLLYLNILILFIQIMKIFSLWFLWV